MKSNKFRLILFFLLLVASVIWLAVLFLPSKNIKIVACDVGQGDASLIVWKNTQVLVDGGPGRDVVSCLSSYLPFWDRNIEAVILTHPQKDHFGGLIEVLKRYDVDLFVANGLDSSTKEYQVLKKEVGGRGIRVVNPSRGMTIRLGMIHLDILWPTKEFLETVYLSQDNVGRRGESEVLGAYTSKKDPNEFSVVALVSFEDFDALFTGDIDKRISDVVAEELVRNPQFKIEYIKVPHHGSKNGITERLVEVLDSKVAVISAGKNNRYGHPHQEILDLLNVNGTRILRTDLVGDVVIESDGETYTVID